jgi:hypothetical protein
MTAETPPMTGSSLGSHGSCALASYGAMTNSTPTLSTWYRHWKQAWINLAYESFWLSKTPTLSLEETVDKSDKEPKLVPWELICHCRQYINYALQLPMHQLLVSNKHQLQGTHKVCEKKMKDVMTDKEWKQNNPKKHHEREGKRILLTRLPEYLEMCTGWVMCSLRAGSNPLVPISLHQQNHKMVVPPH